MKKFTLLILLSVFMYGVLPAQTIEDFEGPAIFMKSDNLVFDKTSFTMVPNPAPTGINTSRTVLKWAHDKDVEGWWGYYHSIDPFRHDSTQYLHVKLWSPSEYYIASGFHPKNENYYGELEMDWEFLMFAAINSSSLNTWVEIVLNNVYYNFTASSFGINTGGNSSDLTLFVDDIYINHDPAVGSAPEFVIEDFEHIPLNVMLGGAEDKSTMEIAPNPDPDPEGANLSAYVIKFVRDKDGIPWGGFWSTLSKPVNVSVPLVPKNRNSVYREPLLPST